MFRPFNLNNEPLIVFRTSLRRKHSEPTFKVGLAVLRISTAHSMSVFGGSSGGTTSSVSVAPDVQFASSDTLRPDKSGCAKGGGSANSELPGQSWLSC